MNNLKQLEAQSIYIFREAYREFKNLAMLWSIGKDSTVLLWLARKAFFGHVPFPLVHIDTAYKIPEMIEYEEEVAGILIEANRGIEPSAEDIKDAILTYIENPKLVEQHSKIALNASLKFSMHNCVHLYEKVFNQVRL